MNRAAVMCTAFPAAAPYLEDCFRSLESQTDRDFSLVLVNDGLDPECLRRMAGPLRPDIVESRRSPAENRMAGIARCLELGADVVVFADCDDTQGPERVAAARAAIGHGQDILCNEVLLAGTEEGGRPWLSRRFTHGQAITAGDIREGNCLGLGNTALRADLLRDVPRVPAAIMAFDWALYGWLLESGRRAVFTDRSWTRYRIHEGNYAGTCQDTPAYLLRCLEVKMRHYGFLAGFFPMYEARARRYAELHAQAAGSERFLDRLFRAWTFRPGDDVLWWDCFTEGREE